MVSVTDAFATENPELVRKFMDVTAKANAAYEADPASTFDRIAVASGMDAERMKSMLTRFGFPDPGKQRSEAYFGGGLAADAKGIARVMKESGSLETMLDDYAPFITDEFLPAP